MCCQVVQISFPCLSSSPLPALLCVCVYVCVSSVCLCVCAGVGMFHSYNTFANNTGLQADSAHQLGVISCHSASRQPLIGRWTTPSGDVIPLTGNEIFSIEYRHGNFPSYTVLSLKPGIHTQLVELLYKDTPSRTEDTSTAPSICIWLCPNPIA